MNNRQTTHQPTGDTSQLLDMYGELKDEVMELREKVHFKSMAALAPGHSIDEPWKPCDQKETSFYGSLTHLH